MPAQTFAYGAYGALGGPPPWGVNYSRGIDVIAARAKKIENVIVSKTYGWTEWRSIAAAIQKQPAGSRTVLFNHSMASNAAPWIADAVYPRPIDLIFAIDPSVWPPKATVLEGNIKKAICVHGTFFFDLVGHAKYVAGERFTGELVFIDRNQQHVTLDDQLDLQSLCVTEIGKVAAR